MKRAGKITGNLFVCKIDSKKKRRKGEGGRGAEDRHGNGSDTSGLVL